MQTYVNGKLVNEYGRPVEDPDDASTQTTASTPTQDQGSTPPAKSTHKPEAGDVGETGQHGDLGAA
jgi:hypothetical protein